MLFYLYNHAGLRYHWMKTTTLTTSLKWLRELLMGSKSTRSLVREGNQMGSQATLSMSSMQGLHHWPKSVHSLVIFKWNTTSRAAYSDSY